MSTQTKRERERDLVWTCRESEVFRRCNLRRFRFRSLWQNIGPPALQLMWATSKLLRAKRENRCFTKAWDLRPETALTAWHLHCVWVNMCVHLSLEVFSEFKAAVSAKQDESIGSCQCFNRGSCWSSHCFSSVCLPPRFFASFYFLVLLSDFWAFGFKDQITEKIKGLQRKLQVELYMAWMSAKFSSDMNAPYIMLVLPYNKTPIVRCSWWPRHSLCAPSKTTHTS